MITICVVLRASGWRWGLSSTPMPKIPILTYKAIEIGPLQIGRWTPSPKRLKSHREAMEQAGLPPDQLEAEYLRSMNHQQETLS